MHIPFLSAFGNALFSTGSGSSADVTIINNDEGTQCTVNNMDDLRAQAKKLITKAVNKGYGNFPVNRTKLIGKMVNRFINEGAVCSALVYPSEITEGNHNDLRQKYKGKSLAPNKAKEWGVVAKRIALDQVCPENFDWSASQYYAGADSCQDVLNAIDSKGLPAVMYSVDMRNADAASTLSDISIAPLYTKYANGGPVVCERTGDHVDAYHKISVINGMTIDYVMRGFEHADWSAWTLLRSCQGPGGTVYESDDLMFNFGARVFIPVDVQEDGVTSHRTLIITSVAAASSNPLAEIVPDSIAFHRLTGGEFAKKALLTAIENGWDVEKN